MRYQYNLSEQDFLIATLYSASKNPLQKKQVRKTIIYLIIAFSIILINIYNQHSTKAFIAFVFIYALIICFYIFFLNKLFIRKQYKKSNRQNLGIRFNKEAVLNFKDDFIETTGMDIKLEIKYDAIEEFNEIPDYYYFKLKTNERLIIPKREIHNKDSFLEMVNNLQNKYNITLTKELDWKW